jgi:hypothetical protein
MKRRSFFQLLFGALLAKWLPKPKTKLDPTRVDIMDLECWGVTEATNVYFEGPVVKSIDPAKPSSLTISYRSHNGYWTAPAKIGSRAPIRIPVKISSHP